MIKIGTVVVTNGELVIEAFEHAPGGALILRFNGGYGIQIATREEVRQLIELLEAAREHLE